MTAPQPATPGSDSVREEITEALLQWWEEQATESLRAVPEAIDSAFEYADALLPLVDRLRAEAKAEALEAAASVAEGTRMAYSPVYAEWLRDRAAAYRTNPSSEETGRG